LLLSSSMYMRLRSLFEGTVGGTLASIDVFSETIATEVQVACSQSKIDTALFTLQTGSCSRFRTILSQCPHNMIGEYKVVTTSINNAVRVLPLLRR
jgi:hypothetical protein